MRSHQAGSAGVAQSGGGGQPDVDACLEAARHVLAEGLRVRGAASAEPPNEGDFSDPLTTFFGADDSSVQAARQLGAALVVPPAVSHSRGMSALSPAVGDPSPPPWLQPLAAVLREGDPDKYREESQLQMVFLQDERTFVDGSSSKQAEGNQRKKEDGGTAGSTFKSGIGKEEEEEEEEGEKWQTSGAVVESLQRGLHADCAPLLPGTRYRFRVRFQVLCDRHTLSMAAQAEPGLSPSTIASQSSLNRWQPWEDAVASSWFRVPASRPRRPPAPMVLVVAPSAARLVGCVPRTNGAGVLGFEFRIRRVRGAPTRRVLEASDSGSDAREQEEPSSSLAGEEVGGSSVEGAEKRRWTSSQPGSIPGPRSRKRIRAPFHWRPAGMEEPSGAGAFLDGRPEWASDVDDSDSELETE